MDNRDAFLRHVCLMVDYWDSPLVGKKSTRERLEGLAFSIMVALDGGAGGLPGYLVIPVSDDLETVGEDEGKAVKVLEEDISGSLHEALSDMLRAYHEGKRPDLGLPKETKGK